MAQAHPVLEQRAASIHLPFTRAVNCNCEECIFTYCKPPEWSQFDAAFEVVLCPLHCEPLVQSVSRDWMRVHWQAGQ